MQKCLMLGAGSKKPMRLFKTAWSAPEDETEWTTLDYYVPADIKLNLWDVAHNSIDLINHRGTPRVPKEEYHEIHAYEVLEHFGQQGIPEHFFNTFNWLWDRLVSQGCLIGTCPLTTGPWVWGDPGHSRVISTESLSFLEETFYEQCGQTAASDYRSLINGYWKILHIGDNPQHGFFEFAIQKVV